MKSFLIVATVALVGSGLVADPALAKPKRSAGMAAMAPALAAGTALIGSGGFIDGPISTPYIGPLILASSRVRR